MSGRVKTALKWAVAGKGRGLILMFSVFQLRALGRYLQNPTELLGTTKLEFTFFSPMKKR